MIGLGPLSLSTPLPPSLQVVQQGGLTPRGRNTKVRLETGDLSLGGRPGMVTVFGGPLRRSYLFSLPGQRDRQGVIRRLLFIDLGLQGICVRPPLGSLLPTPSPSPSSLPLWGVRPIPLGINVRSAETLHSVTVPTRRIVLGSRSNPTETCAPIRVLDPYSFADSYSEVTPNTSNGCHTRTPGVDSPPRGFPDSTLSVALTGTLPSQTPTG